MNWKRLVNASGMVLLSLRALPAVAVPPAGATIAPQGCDVSGRPAAIAIHGTIEEGGASSTFERTIDLRTGFSRTVRDNGAQQSLDGFDGVAWGYANGIPAIIDVPPLVPDAAAHAFVDRLGWQDAKIQSSQQTRKSDTLERRYSPPHTSTIAVYSRSQSARPFRVTVDADGGLETIDLTDWRCVGGISYPFEQTTSDTTGETQTLRALRVEPTQPSLHEFHVPLAHAHGSLSQSAPQPFRYGGKRDRHIIVDAAVGGAPVQLIFDTGGADYFGVRTAQKLGLSVSGGLSITGVGNGSTSGGFVRVPSISIAGATLKDETALVGPLPWPESATAPAGSTGFEFLAEFRTTIDFPNQSIAFANFSDAMPSQGIRIPLRFEGHDPFVEARINGIPSWFRVDTGDGNGITLFATFARRAGVEADPSAKQTTAGGAGGTTVMKQSRIATFSLGSIRLENAPVRLSEAAAGSFASRSLAGNLGNALFHCFKVTFDYRGAEMLLSPDPSTDACLRELVAP